MSIQDPPKIDTRSARDIFEAAASHLKNGPLAIDAKNEDSSTEALLRVFARYCELIIQRLNKVPEKNHAAFLDTLNMSRIPPVAARVAADFAAATGVPITLPRPPEL